MSTSKSLKRAARALAAERALPYAAALDAAKTESTPLMFESDRRPAPFDPARSVVISGSHACGKSTWANAMRAHAQMLGRTQVRITDNDHIERAPGALIGERFVDVHELPAGLIDPLRAMPGNPVARMLALEFVLAFAPHVARRHVSSLDLEPAVSIRDLVERCAASTVAVIASAGESALEVLAHRDFAMLGEPCSGDEFAAVFTGPTTIITHGGTNPYSSSGRVELALRAMAVFSLGHRLGAGATVTLDDLEQHGTEGVEHGWAGLDALHLALMSQPAPFVLVADVDSSLHARVWSLNADIYRLSAARARTFARALPAGDRRGIPGHDDASMMPLWRDGELVRGSIAARGDEFVMLSHQPAGFERWCAGGEFIEVDRRDDPPITLAPTRAGSGRVVRLSDFIARALDGTPQDGTPQA